LSPAFFLFAGEAAAGRAMRLDGIVVLSAARKNKPERRYSANLEKFSGC